jgi:hypothetical protein
VLPLLAGALTVPFILGHRMLHLRGVALAEWVPCRKALCHLLDFLPSEQSMWGPLTDDSHFVFLGSMRSTYACRAYEDTVIGIQTPESMHMFPYMAKGFGQMWGF